MLRKKSIGNLILLSLEKAVDGIVRYDDLIHHSSQYAWGGRWDKPLKKSALAQALKRLRERGFIDKKTYKDTDKIILRLTDVGKEFLLLQKSDDEIEWDGKWRIVVFDIPERNRLVRDILRSRLKIWGFKRWQQSVWASKRGLTEKLRNLIRELGIDDWVLVIESDNVGK